MNKFQTYQMRGDFVPPLTGAAIRQKAEHTRKVLDLPPEGLPLWGLLDRLSDYGLDFDVVEDHNMPCHHAEACCIPDSGIIFIPQKSVRAIDRDEPRMRFTIFHEIGHFVLGHRKSFARGNQVPKAYLDSEWQADKFSAELLMPASVIVAEGINNLAQMRARFGASGAASANRLADLRREGLIPKV